MLSKLFFSAALLALLFTAPLAAQSGKYETTLRNFWAAVDMGNFDKAASMLSPDVKVYIPVSPKPLTREEYRQVGEGFRMGFPDISHKVLECTESGMTVAMRGLFTGTNTGTLMGNPPTGNRVEAPFLCYVAFDASGKIIRFETAFDLASFNAQVMGGDPMARIEMSKQNIRAAYDALNRKDWNAFAALCDEKKYTDVNVAPVTIVGVWEALEGYKQFFNAFTDFKIAVNEIAPISPARYLVRVTLSGKHTGNLMGVPATGKTMKYDDVDIVELDAQGKCIYHEPTKGGREVFRQLGVDPMALAAEATIRAMLAAADEGNTDKFMSYWAPGAINYFSGKQTSGDDMKKRIAGMKASFPDIKRVLDDVVVSGNIVTVKGWVTGTNKGTYQGQPATGNSIKVAWLGLYKLNAEGKVQEGTVEFDTETLNSQIKGIAPGATLANKQAVQKIMENLDKHDLNAVTAAFAPGCRFYGWEPQAVDVNNYKQNMSNLIASFPDARFIVEDVVAAGDKVVVRHRFEGTHTGAAFQGTPKSSKRAVASATVTFQMKDGKPVELWLNADFLGLLMQIGAIPAPNR